MAVDFKPNQSDYKNLTPFKSWLLLQINTWGQNNFPFVESDFDELTNYGMMQKLMKALNDVISNENMVEDDMTNIFNAFTELQNYVNDYFDNLDVQEEINNKLDSMAEDGTLTNLIKDYVDPIYQEYENSINNTINNINNKVNSLASGSPIPVSSTSAMTDTSRVYLNTTDGKWYYYNGTQWTIGGTYQSTGIGEKEVSYINETDILRNNEFKQINADDLIWRFYSCVNGGLANSSTTITCTAFLAPKGSVINMSDDVNGRITLYNLDKSYKSNTGAFTTIKNYIVQEDCYVRISISSTTGTTITINDGNSTNVQLTGIIPNNIGLSILKGLVFNQYTSAYYFTNPIYVNKGTKISLIDGALKNSAGESSGAIINFGVREGNQQIEWSNGSLYHNADYIVQNTGFIQLSFQFGGPTTDYHLSRVKNLFTIDLVKYEPLKSHINAYISNNANIDIIEQTEGKIAFNFEHGLNIYNGNLPISEILWEDIKTTLSDNIITINDKDYIQLPYRQAVYYNLNTSTIQILKYSIGSINVNSEMICLIANGYGQAINGLLLDLYNKNQSIKGDAIRLNEQLFNSSPFIKSYDWKTPSKSYSYKLNNLSNNVEKFFFFTDPHLLGSNNTFNETRLRDWLCALQKIYNSTPSDYIVSGGDWLTDGDSQEYACFKLGYMDGFTKTLFKNYFPINGNHDTNYQGKLTDESSANTGTLTNDTIINLMFNEHKKMYYSFDGINSKNYVLDSGIDWTTSMDSYRWEQINWLGNKLLEDDPQHAMVMMHIIWNSVSASEPLPFTDNLTKLLEAFNHHESITLNSLTYDFTQTTGHVDYVLGGHLHTDHHDWINNILCIATTTFALNQTTPTFDMIVNDYDNNKAYFTRVGIGNSREFDI